MNNEISNKPLVSVTVDEFLEAAAEKFGLSPATFTQEDEVQKPNLIYGLQALASLLGVSLSTAQRIKKSGILDRATYQYGKVYSFDSQLVLDLLSVKKHHHIY